jgi:hypothetical protein
MWDVDNLTDFGAAAGWIRDKNGAHRWLVAVKATFDVRSPGILVLADEQHDPVRIPMYRGDPRTTSLLLDSDLLGERPRTEVLLDASAYAPNGRPADVVEVSLQAGSLKKSLLVFGPRIYRYGVRGLAISTPEPFLVRPIHYEWAFGGADLSDPDPRKHKIDLRNPVGKGIGEFLDDQPAHAVEYPRGDAAKIGPAGFGPIAPSWTPRMQRAGTYDSAWDQNKKPLLPDDFDPIFAMSAPDDQWCSDTLRPGDPVILTNLCEDGQMRFEVPDISFSFETYFGTDSLIHEGHLSALIIVPDKKKVSMVWQTSIGVRGSEADYLDFTTIQQR